MWFFRREPSSRAAEKLVARGKIEKAIRMYRRVLHANPGDSSTLNRVGDLLARVDKYSEAIELYRETAELFVEQGFYVKAIAVYKKIHRIDPSHLDVYRKLADLYTLQGLHNDARTHYEVLVDYHERQNDLPAAIGVCRKLAELQPQDPAHRTRLAELYERKGDTASVAREYLEIARMMLRRGAIEKATQILERALAVNGADPAFLIDTVRLLRAEGQHDFSATFLDEAEEMNVRAGRPQLVADIREQLEPEQAAPVAPAVPAAPAARTPVAVPGPAGVPIDPEEEVYLLQVDDEAAPEQTVEDALAEIEVFVKYGFREKALDRLGELLRGEPANQRAHRLLIDLLLKDGSHRAVVDAANQMAAGAASSGDAALWNETRDRLRGLGFLVAGNVVRAPPAEIGEEGEEFELLETGGPPAASAPDLGAIVAQARQDSAAATDLFELLPSAIEPFHEAGAPEPASDVARPPFGVVDDKVDFVVVDDGEFADLAAEVELEMETAGAAPPTEMEAPSVEEIVASFKQGVAENLSPEDYDTHYNLGIAYREMGLVDEAIGEFEIAALSRDYLIGCCSMLGLCFRDKGEMESAREWYSRGLEVPDILDHERYALLYDLGEVYETAGDLDSARKAFAEISLADSSYRDVDDRLAALS